MNSSVAKLVIIPDAEREPDEHICLNVSQIAGSTTTLRKDQQQVTFVVTDVDLDATLDLDCTRGFGCQVDLSETWFWEFDLGTVQDASSSNYECLPCQDVENSSDSINFTVAQDPWIWESSTL